jgi:hypothetical protein
MLLHNGILECCTFSGRGGSFMNKRLVIRKIPLLDFINILIEVYDQGAEYIDISADSKLKQDHINISILDEYYLEQGPLDELPEETKILSFNDLNQLL